MKQLIALLLFTVGVSFFAHAEKTTSLNPVFIVTDVNGNTMQVKNLQLLIVRGSDQELTDSFTVLKGDSQITLSFNDLLGFKNHWKTNEVELFFKDGQHFKAKIPAGVKFHQLKGTALLGNLTAPYKLDVPKLLSAYRQGFKPKEK